MNTYPIIKTQMIAMLLLIFSNGYSESRAITRLPRFEIFKGDTEYGKEIIHLDKIPEEWKAILDEINN